jgi:hypothetical protein
MNYPLLPSAPGDIFRTVRLRISDRKAGCMKWICPLAMQLYTKLHLIRTVWFKYSQPVPLFKYFSFRWAANIMYSLSVLRRCLLCVPVPMPEWCEARTVFGRWNTGLVGSNPTRGMDVCPRFSVLCYPVCRKGPCVGPITPLKESYQLSNRFLSFRK